MIATRRITVFRFAFRLAVFPTKLLYASCVTSAGGAHPCARQFLSLSIGWRRRDEVIAPYQFPIVKQVRPVLQLPLWRPARRQDARRYVKELRSFLRNTDIIPHHGGGDKCKIKQWRGGRQHGRILCHGKMA